MKQDAGVYVTESGDIINYNRKYYRLHYGECLHDGESWSVNVYYEQAVIITANDETSNNAIVKAIKASGIVNKYLQNNRFCVQDTDPDTHVEYWFADNREPIMIRLGLIDPEDVERELNASYFPRRMTQVFDA